MDIVDPGSVRGEGWVQCAAVPLRVALNEYRKKGAERQLGCDELNRSMEPWSIRCANANGERHDKIRDGL